MKKFAINLGMAICLILGPNVHAEQSALPSSNKNTPPPKTKKPKQYSPKKYKSVRNRPDNAFDTAFSWHLRSQYIKQQLQTAADYIEHTDYETADNFLNKILEMKIMSEPDAVLIWQYKARVAYMLADHDSLSYAYRQILNYKRYISPDFKLKVISALAYLNFQRSNFREAQRWMAKYEQSAGENIPATHLKFISEIHYSQAELSKALSYISQAIEKVQEEETNSNYLVYYDLKLSTQLEMEAYKDAENTLNILLTTWPDPYYCELAAGTLMRSDSALISIEAIKAIRRQYSACSSLDDVIIP